MQFRRTTGLSGALRAAALAWVFGAVAACDAGTTAPDRATADAPRVSANAESSRQMRGSHAQERFLYVATIAQSATDPDFVAVIGADPGHDDFGEIVNRVDMPNVGDELHHFGYSANQRRLIVPGLFSNRIHVFDIGRDGSSLSLRAVNEQLTEASGYVVPHSVIAARPGRVLVTMIGAATGSTRPGGIVRVNDATGGFEGYFGPGPDRDASEVGPEYMYHFEALREANRGISTTFGPPAACGPGIDPACLGGTVSVWDLRREQVIQEADLGEHSGALEVRFLDEPGARRALINTPGTSAVWLAHDDGRDGTFVFTQVLGPEDGLQLPVDMVVSHDGDHMYLTNWFGNTVQQFDISDPFDPVPTTTVAVPHPNMLRLSPDGRRLYVSNSLISTWDNDASFGDPRNDDYGIWLFHVGEEGELMGSNSDGSAWVSFSEIEKQNTTGPAGPHMMLFDPSVRTSGH